MAGPDFLCIGAQKAGTTWLWRNLAAHPGVWLPERVKEFHYFDDRADLLTQGWRRRLRGKRRADRRWRRRAKTIAAEHRRERTLRGLAWETGFLLRRPSDRWYLSRFDAARGRLSGDMTPDYLALDGESVARVAAMLPGTRIVLLMRNPIERLWSAASFFKTLWSGRRPSDLEREEVRRFFRAPANRRLTDYPAGLRRWERHYPPERIFVGFTEDIHFHPDALLERVEAFLGLEPLGDHAAARARVNWMPTREMPGWAAADLAALNAGLLAALAGRFGGYTTWWQAAGEVLAGADPEADLEYPLFLGPLWRDWVSRRGEDPAAWEPPLQSGLLAAILDAGREPGPV